MGRVRSPHVRSRIRWYRRILLDPAALRYWLAVAALAIVLAGLVPVILLSWRLSHSRPGEHTHA